MWDQLVRPVFNAFKGSSTHHIHSHFHHYIPRLIWDIFISSFQYCIYIFNGNECCIVRNIYFSGKNKIKAVFKLQFPAPTNNSGEIQANFRPPSSYAAASRPCRSRQIGVFSDGKFISTQIKQHPQPPSPPPPPSLSHNSSKSFWGFKSSSSCGNGNGYARSL